MKLGMFSVFDKAAGVYNQPSYFRTNNEALRWFQELCNDSKSVCFKHPQDYSLFVLGEFDDLLGSGQFQPAIKIAEASALKREQFNDAQVDIPVFGRQESAVAK